MLEPFSLKSALKQGSASHNIFHDIARQGDRIRSGPVPMQSALPAMAAAPFDLDGAGSSGSKVRHFMIRIALLVAIVVAGSYGAAVSMQNGIARDVDSAFPV